MAPGKRAATTLPQTFYQHWKCNPDNKMTQRTLNTSGDNSHIRCRRTPPHPARATTDRRQLRITPTVPQTLPVTRAKPPTCALPRARRLWHLPRSVEGPRRDGEVVRIGIKGTPLPSCGVQGEVQQVLDNVGRLGGNFRQCRAWASLGASSSNFALILGRIRPITGHAGQLRGKFEQLRPLLGVQV